MRFRYALVGIVALGASMSFALHEVGIAAWRDGFENPEPSFFYRLGWLWTILYWAAPGLVVGHLVRRNAGWLSALSYLLGSIASFCYHDGENQSPHRFLPDLVHWPWLLRNFLLFALLGAIMGLIAAWLRHRQTMNPSQYRDIVVTFAGIVAMVVLSDLTRIAGSGLFEVDKPTLFARLQTLWSLMFFVVPGVAIGIGVTKRAVPLGAIAYALGELIIIYRSSGFGYRAVGDFLPERQYLLDALRGALIFGVLGGVMGWIGAWLRRRLHVELAQPRVARSDR